MAPKVWFVTGSSSGLGLSVVKHALSKGDNVVATLRKPEVLSAFASNYPTTQLLLVKLDVTNPQDITSAFAVAHEKFGRVDVVYNNAGFGVISEIESAPEKDMRGMFEVNFWGAVNVSREAVRVFRDVNSPSGGRLIQACSVAGVTGNPTTGHYSATKFAIGGLSEALAKEVDPSWNIKVTILYIGGFRTPGAHEGGSLSVIPPHPKYEKSTELIRSLVVGGVYATGDSAKAGREIHRIANDESAPLHIALGLDAIEIVKGKIAELNVAVERSVAYSVGGKTSETIRQSPGEAKPWRGKMAKPGEGGE